jgi:flagellar basal body-associated protein FliL
MTKFLERKRPAFSKVALPFINIVPDTPKSKKLVTVILPSTSYFPDDYWTEHDQPQPPKDPPQPTTNPPQQVEDLPEPAANLAQPPEDNVLTKELLFEMMEEFNKESLNQLKNILKQP